MLSALIDLLAPPACLACGAPPAAGGPLCRDCRVALPFLGPERCPRCALPGPCGRRCPARRLAFDRVWAPVAYDGPARALVLALKERGALGVARTMAAQMAATAPPGLLEGAVLVPVPADPARRRRRGLDHSGLLARELGRRCGLDVRSMLRRSAGARQAGASRAERRRAGRLPVEPRGRPGPPVAVLIDDVCTTGATLHACALALRSVGSRHVAALCYARTLP